jgi:hypothetical protein
VVAARLIFASCLAACLVFSLPVAAHHSFAAYESVKRISLEGAATSVQWGNPHVVIRMLTQASGGEAPQEWTLVTSNPGILKRFGWTQRSVTPGTRIRVLCYPKRDGSHAGRLITLFQLDSDQTLQTKLSGSQIAD